MFRLCLPISWLSSVPVNGLVFSFGPTHTCEPIPRVVVFSWFAITLLVLFWVPSYTIYRARTHRSVCSCNSIFLRVAPLFGTRVMQDCLVFAPNGPRDVFIISSCRLLIREYLLSASFFPFGLSPYSDAPGLAQCAPISSVSMDVSCKSGIPRFCLSVCATTSRVRPVRSTLSTTPSVYC